MTSILVRFFMGKYGGHTPSGQPEWPPAPSRVFSALVAHADEPARDVLRVVERQVPPIVHAGHAHRIVGRSIASAPRKDPSSFGAGDAAAKNLSTLAFRAFTHYGTGAVAKVAPQVALDGDTVVMELAEPLTDEQVAALDRAAAKVAYVGSPGDAAAVTVTNEPVGDVASGLTRMVPVVTPAGSSRCWGPGYMDALDARYALDDRGSGSLHFPAHPDTTTVTTDFIPARLRETSGVEVMLRLQQTRTVSVATAKFIARVCRDSGGVLRPVLNPHNGDLNGFAGVLDAEDPDRVAGVYAAVGAPVEPGPESWRRRVFGQGRWWFSTTPVQAPSADVAAARVEADLTRLTGEVPAVEVFPEPELARTVCGPTPDPGMRLFRVLVVFDEEVAGPLSAGFATEAGAGVLAPARRDRLFQSGRSAA